MLATIMPGVQHLTRTGQFLSTVTDLRSLSPRMRRIALSAPAVAGTDWPLACDIAIVLGGQDRELRRRYTVRAVRGETLLVDAVLHGHGPGSTWAQQLQVGDQVSFFGPRGEIVPAEADWLLALSDEAGLPAIGALAEALETTGRTLTVLAEIAEPDEHYPLPANAQVRWLVRGQRPAGQADLLVESLTGFTPGAGRGYAYLLGESRVVVAVRDELARFGLDRAAVYAKGYWNLNSRPTR
ncbi:MAG: siderophore-interacting protein [Jatrophihabitans sp.]